MDNAPAWGSQEAEPADVRVSDLEKLCSDIVAARTESESQKARYSEAVKKVDGLELILLEKLQALGKKHYLSNVGRFGITYRSSVKIPRGSDWEAFRTYLESTGEAQAMLTVNSQSLNGWYKQKLEQAQEAGTADAFNVPGIAEPSITPIVSFRKN